MSRVNLITGNKYIDTTTELFALIYEDNCNTKRYLGKNTFKDEKLNKCFKEIEGIRDELLTQDLDFTGLRKMTDYITTLEKAFLYKNDSEVNKVTCISPTDSDKKTLYINDKEANVEIEISAFFDYSEGREAVKMTIKRTTGRAIINKWIVYDGVINNKLENNDIITIMTLNNYVRTVLSELFYSFANLILNKQLFDFEFRNEVNKL